MFAGEQCPKNAVEIGKRSNTRQDFIPSEHLISAF